MTPFALDPRIVNPSGKLSNPKFRELDLHLHRAPKREVRFVKNSQLIAKTLFSRSALIVAVIYSRKKSRAHFGFMYPPKADKLKRSDKSLNKPRWQINFSLSVSYAKSCTACERRRRRGLRNFANSSGESSDMQPPRTIKVCLKKRKNIASSCETIFVVKVIVALARNQRSEGDAQRSFRNEQFWPLITDFTVGLILLAPCISIGFAQTTRSCVCFGEGGGKPR